MKNRLKILVTAILCLSHLSFSQDSKTKCQFETAKLIAPKVKFAADEILELNGTIPISFDFITYDSVSIDSIKIATGSFFISDSLTLLSGLYDSGIVEDHSFNLLYDTAIIPYYIKEIKLIIYSDYGMFSSMFWIYFTPYNTIEILNHENLTHNRKWVFGDENLYPSRIYIPYDSIETNIDTLSYRLVSPPTETLMIDYPYL